MENDMTLREAALELGINIDSVRSLCWNLRLCYRKDDGGRIWIPASEVARYKQIREMRNRPTGRSLSMQPGAAIA